MKEKNNGINTGLTERQLSVGHHTGGQSAEGVSPEGLHFSNCIRTQWCFREDIW